MLPPNHEYLCTKVLNIITNDYNLNHQWQSKSQLTTVRLHVLKVVLPKVQFCWVLTKHFQGFSNCPTRCDLFSLLHFCRQLYMFRVLTPVIRSWYSCNYSFWYWLTGSTTIRFRCWVGTDSVPTQQRGGMLVDPVNFSHHASYIYRTGVPILSRIRFWYI